MILPLYQQIKGGVNSVNTAKHKMTTNNQKFQLAATYALEYNTSTGWRMSDSAEAISEDFDTKEEALAAKADFIASLKISENEVCEINLYTFTFELDEEGNIDEDHRPEFDNETIEFIDGSASLPTPKYVLSRYFGTYMIGTSKSRLDYAPNMTINQLMLRVENSSYHYHPIQVFQTEEEAKAAIDFPLEENCFDWETENN